jgi:N-acetylmuramate 1-kinase
MALSAARDAEIRAFLDSAGFGAARREALPGDASTRTYERLWTGTRAVLLMNQPQAAEAASCPPDADEAARRALGYNACARLAGANLTAFAALSRHLRTLGLSAPEVLAADIPKGLLVIEDFGDRIYARLVEDGADAAALYGRAMDALSHLHDHEAPAAIAFGERTHHLLAYDALALETEAALLPEWHGKLLLGGALSGDALEEYRGLWAALLPQAIPARKVLTLRDYHAENLLFLDEREGAAQAGLIDFQDGLAGHPAYDLISLLEDARRDVTPELAAAMTDRYARARAARDPHFDREAFEAAAAILAAQRNAKIAGIFARLFLRDSKPRYLSFLPRVWGHLERDLEHPAMAGLKRWFARAIPADKRGRAAAGLAP